MRLASHLGMSVQRCQTETTISEFRRWMIYLEELRIEPFKQREKLDFLLAMIAAEVRRSWVKHPGKVKVKDFIYEPQDIKLVSAKLKTPTPVRKMSFKEKVAAIKARTFAAFGQPKES